MLIDCFAINSVPVSRTVLRLLHSKRYSLDLKIKVKKKKKKKGGRKKKKKKRDEKTSKFQNAVY